MEKIKFFSRKLIIKSIGVVIVFMSFYFVFDNLDSYNQYKSLQSKLNSKLQYVTELQNDIDQMNQQINDLEDPEKLDALLRERGYGKPGETIDIFEVPEPVTPLEETLISDRSKSFMEYVVEFIVGTDSG
jgi:cell division protein FtsB|tara:strand:+ start:64 stop:453 length:390 start_codon:yes stop_codon:yes gene_type:complete